MTGRAARWALAAPLVAVALAAAGCAGTATTAEPAGPAAGTTSAAARPSAAGASSAAPSVTASPSGEPSLPPGDPGLDAPTASDPGTAGLGGDHRKALRQVPAAALLGPVDAGQMLGGRWATAAADLDGCALPASYVGRGTVGLASAGGDSVTEAVSTHRGAAAADAAVAALRTRLPDCGWDLGADPRLGSASLTATRGDVRLGVVAAEGVTVVMVGQGSRVTGFGWSGLLDMALGTSCAASVDGCH